jgi:hypothetical protein
MDPFKAAAYSVEPDILWEEPGSSDPCYEVNHELSVFELTIAGDLFITKYSSNTTNMRIGGLKYSTNYTIQVVAVPMETSLANRSHPQYLTVVTPHYCKMNLIICAGLPLIVIIIVIAIILTIAVVYYFSRKHCSIHPCKQSCHHKSNGSRGTSVKRIGSESSGNSGSSTGSGKPLLV